MKYKIGMMVEYTMEDCPTTASVIESITQTKTDTIYNMENKDTVSMTLISAAFRRVSPRMSKKKTAKAVTRRARNSTQAETSVN